MPIHKLDENTANQIAAGEVVENPSSVVKELLENALDAGAKRIRITLKKGGLEEITVIDDGSGIPSAELPLAFQRHATSKIKILADLEIIKTLGFRGEALPSIASVSKISLTTRHKTEETGSYLSLEAGKEQEFQKLGFPVGTRVSVRNLFFNTPARRKFLKGISAETARISRTVQILALSRPDVSFVIQKESGTFLETPGDGRLLNVISSIFGSNMVRELVPVDHFVEGDISLSGYISNLTYTRNNRNYQFFYVNNRYVRSSFLRNSLDKCFRDHVTSKRYPVAFLFLQIPPREMDVNVHPAKIEVRFHREDSIDSFLQKALKTSFSGSFIPSWSPKTQGTADPRGTQFSVENEKFTEESKTSIRETGAPQNYYSSSNKIPDTSLNKTEAAAERTAYPTKDKKEDYFETKLDLDNDDFFKGRFLGQVFSSYILIEGKKGENFYFLDQHAAHERVLWENIQLKKQEDSGESQATLPLTIELPLSLAEALSTKLEFLKEIGLELEQFGNNTFILRAVPFALQEVITSEVLLDILEEVTSQNLFDSEYKKHTLLQLACKGAIKANQSLAKDEIESLLEQLEKCTNPFYCPHGRPVFFQIGKNELERYFKRRS